ncbi:hypothetical protein P7C71_g1147, partial [Lecanoromycetidae sp. Uapishka_2]
MPFPPPPVETIGFIGVKQEGEHFTLSVPDSKNVIKSVTSDSVQELARSFGWKVEKRPIKYEELPSFTEIMAAGTAAALVPIKSITMRSRNDKFLYQGGGDEPGPACVKLLTTLKGIQQGKIKDQLGWLDHVKEVKLPSKHAHTNGVDVKEDLKGNVDKLP